MADFLTKSQQSCHPGESLIICHPGESLIICHPGESRGPDLPESLNSEHGPAGHHPTCTLFENCLAPLCPLDTVSLKGVWYPDEEICRSRSQGGRPWIRSQRRIAKVAGHGAGYFTFEMLSRLVVIRKGITGLDPDLSEEAQLRAWFQKRPERQDRAPGDQAARARHLRKFGFRKKGSRKEAGAALKRG